MGVTRVTRLGGGDEVRKEREMGGICDQLRPSRIQKLISDQNALVSAGQMAVH
jgi:hypothetical protein